MRDLLPHALPDPCHPALAVLGHGVGDDRRPTPWQLGQGRGRHVAEHRHRDRPRDRRRRHDEHVRRGRALGPQRVPLLHPEAVLLVDDHEGEVAELDDVLEQGVRADDDAGLTGDDRQHGLLAGGPAHAAGEQRHLGSHLATAQHAGLGERPEHRRDGAVVLLGQHLGRREQRRLAPGVDDGEHRPERDDRLARAHLALQQPVHRDVAGQVGRDLHAHRDLAVGEVERHTGVEGVEEPAGRRGPRGRGLPRRRPGAGRARSG